MTLGVTSTATLYGGEARTAGLAPVYAPVSSAATQDAAAFDHLVRQGLSSGAASSGAVAAAQKSSAPADEASSENGFFSFIKAVIDVINPLQHIPVVATIYRAVTGDEISPAARLVGDTLYGGPVGAAIAVANIASEEISGKDIGGNVVALATGGRGIQVGDTALADRADHYFKQQVASIIPAGQKDSDGIIWTTPPVAEQNFPPTVGPTPHTKTAENIPASESYRNRSYTSDVQPESEAKTENPKPMLPTAHAVETLSGLQSHDAPVDHGRKPPSGRLAADKSAAPGAAAQKDIAVKMMEALDKYSAMKKAGLQPDVQNYPMF